MVEIVDLLHIKLAEHGDAWWFCVGIIDGPGAREGLADLLAVDIATRLCEGSDEALGNWTERKHGGPPHDDASRLELEAYLLADFAETKDKNWTRLGGAVVEHLWAAIAGSLDGGWGLPLHVEHEHFSVIDHGGDGLSIYAFGAPDLRFRLWESKQHTSQTSSVTTVVTGAAVQLTKGAPEYLARMSKPLQLHDDPRIQHMAGKMVKLWTTNADDVGVGVSVGTTIGSLPARPFKGLKDNFGFSDPVRREGVVIQISDLEHFAQQVRAALLLGIY